MRQSLLFGGLESISYNINRKSTDLKLYEFGKIYTYNAEADNAAKVTKRFAEEKHLAIFLSGRKMPESWSTANTTSDFFSLKVYVENIFKRLRISTDKMQISKTANSVFSEALTYVANGKTLLSVGSLQNKLLLSFGIKQPVFYADFNWDLMIKLIPTKEINYTEVTKFPEVRRDLALLINKEVTFAEIVKLAYQTEKNILQKVNLFDVYEGDKLEAGKKSYAVSFILQDKEKTLNDKQIEGIMNKLIKVYTEKLQAIIR
jgi:phenylalanyl-tRNA synthetase beta chain